MTRVAIMDTVYSFIGYSVEEIKDFLGVSRLNKISVNQALKYTKKRVFINTLSTKHV